jgi:predicted transcriptional regulator
MASSDKKTVKHLELGKNSYPRIEIGSRVKPSKDMGESKNNCCPQAGRSKLMLCIDILRILENGVQINTKQIPQKANIRNITTCIQCLDLLAKQKLIKTIDKDATVYSITQKGLTVLEYFSRTSALFPLDNTSSGSNILS